MATTFHPGDVVRLTAWGALQYEQTPNLDPDCADELDKAPIIDGCIERIDERTGLALVYFEWRSTDATLACRPEWLTEG